MESINTNFAFPNKIFNIGLFVFELAKYVRVQTELIFQRDILSKASSLVLSCWLSFPMCHIPRVEWQDTMRRDGVIEKEFFGECDLRGIFSLDAGGQPQHFFVVGFRESSIMQYRLKFQFRERRRARKCDASCTYAGANYFSSPSALAAFVSPIDTRPIGMGKISGRVYITSSSDWWWVLDNKLVNLWFLWNRANRRPWVH